MGADQRGGEWLIQKWENPHRALTVDANTRNDSSALNDADDFEPEYTADYDVWRNYKLFSMLAGVRNGGEDIIPLAQPRGLPDSLPLLDEENILLCPDGEEVWMGNHSFSWLEYEELTSDAYWRQTVRLQGYVPEEDYARLLTEGGTPKKWQPSLYYEHQREISAQDMQALIAAPVMQQVLRALANEQVAYFTRMQWEEPYRRLAGQFYDELLPKLAHLRAQADVKDVRIVFGFDN